MPGIVTHRSTRIRAEYDAMNQLSRTLRSPRTSTIFSIVIRMGWIFLPILGVLIGLGNFFNRRQLPVTPVDAALIFGTGLAWKAQSRCATAAEVFQRGLVRYLIVSGGVLVPGTNTPEAVWFRDQL